MKSCRAPPLEADDRSTPRGFEDLPLFAAIARPVATATLDPAATAVLTLLAEINPDEMSPRQALEALYALKLEAASEKEANSE